jgi:DNA-binding NarL/FixJ family response regulator
MSEDQKRIRVLTVDDHPLVLEGIGAIINCQADMTLAGTASSGAGAIEAFRRLRPHVTLMDLQLPDLSGLEAMMSIREEFPDAAVIILTTYERDVEIQRALTAGARGYLLKSMPPDLMLETIRQVHSGRRYVPPQIAAKLAEHFADQPLSEREVQVLNQVADGNSNRDIARRLSIAEDTVKVHLKHIAGKLGTSARTQSVAMAARRGIIRL